jgi:hypothetical protein
MPFNTHGNRAFTFHSIGNNAPAASGVYGLSNAAGWIYVGESDDIQGQLLRHLRSGDAIQQAQSPSGFTFELCAREHRLARQQQLVIELAPIGNPRATS